MKIISSLISAICIFALGVSQNVELPTEIASDAEEYIEEHVACSINAKSVSIEEIVSSEVPFYGENCAEILLRILEDNGLEAIYYGTTDDDFYLAGISGIDTSGAKVADELIPFLTENEIEYEEKVNEEGLLGEFDFTESAGWVYTVNGEMPDVGMNSYIPQDGDEIEFIFTLYYGEDIYLID